LRGVLIIGGEEGTHPKCMRLYVQVEFLVLSKLLEIIQYLLPVY